MRIMVLQSQKLKNTNVCPQVPGADHDGLTCKGSASVGSSVYR